MAYHAAPATDGQTNRFWSRLSKSRTGMLMVQDRHLPMSHYADQDNSTIWFLSAKDTPMAEAAAKGEITSYIVSNDEAGIYADIKGALTIQDNPEKIDELWGPIAASWYDEGRDDPDIRLLKFDITRAEAWTTDGTLKFLYETVRANITEEKPDVGENFELRIAA
jgi:general stress protein 26